MRKHIKAKIDIRKSRPVDESRAKVKKVSTKPAKKTAKKPKRKLKRKATAKQSSTGTTKDKKTGKGKKVSAKRTNKRTKTTSTGTQSQASAASPRKGASIGKSTKIRRPNTARRREKGSQKAPDASAASIHGGFNEDGTPKGRPPVDYQAEAYAELPGPEKISRRGRKLQEPTRKLVRQIFNLVKIGNYPEVVCKALGIRYAVFVAWTKRGLADLVENKDSVFAMFVAAVDAGVAQDEIASMSLISKRVNNWQALAWKLERSKFKRWGQRTAVGVGSLEEMTEQQEQAKLPFDRMGEVLAIMEQAGVLPTTPEELASPETLEGNVIEVTATTPKEPKDAADIDIEPPGTVKEVPEAVAEVIAEAAGKVGDILFAEDVSLTSSDKPEDELKDEPKLPPVERHPTTTSQTLRELQPPLPGHSGKR